VHGDNPVAVQMVKKIREDLKTAGVDVTPMKNFI
jgi:lactam utilization protein B